MRILFLLSVVTLAAATANETSTQTTTTAVTSVSPSPSSESSATGQTIEPPSARIPRGTVYQIRPVNFRNLNQENPFANIDTVTDFKFPQLKSVVADSIAAESSSRYETDSDAEEAVDLPKYLLAAASGGGSSSEEETEPQRQSGNSGNSEKREKRKKSTQENVPKDASYAFGYTLEDQTRHEIADPNGNVNGYYQFVDDEGYIRKVVYKAGPGTGFVVLNKERTKGPVTLKSPKIPNRSKSPSNSGGGPPSSGERSNSGDNSPAPSDNNARPSQVFQESNNNRDNNNNNRDNNRDDGEDAGYPPPNWINQNKKSSRKPIYVVKIRRPQQSHYAPATIYATQPSHYPRKRQQFRTNHQQQEFVDDESPLVFLAGSGAGQSSSEDDGSYKEEYNGSGSEEDNGQWNGDTGNYNNNNNRSPFQFKSNNGNRNNKISDDRSPNDGSYSFGYETETANRLEKSDNFGNVRGSYSYVDNNGIKRTVHYVAGASTGFQVLGSSPSAARSVRIEAPPGFVVTRRRSPTLAVAGSEYRSYPSQPSAVVYHIHPDSGWKPWESISRKPRKMRKVMRIHRKKPRPYPKDLEFVPSPKDTVNSPQGVETGAETSYVVQTHPEQRPFRHSTRVQIQPENIGDSSVTYFRRRQPSHRAYTTDLSDSRENEESLRNDPILFSPNYEALNERRRGIPNPILLKPSSVLVRNRGSNSPFEVSESMIYPVRSNGPYPTADTLQQSESINSPTNFPTSTSTSTTISMQKSSQKKSSSSSRGALAESISSTTVTPSSVTGATASLDAPSTTSEAVPLNSGSSSTLLTTVRSTRRRGQGKKASTSSESKTASPTVVRMTRSEISKTHNEEISKDVMSSSSSSRLMQRLHSSDSNKPSN